MRPAAAEESCCETEEEGFTIAPAEAEEVGANAPFPCTDWLGWVGGMTGDKMSNSADFLVVGY